MSYWELETNFPYKVKTFSQQHCTVVKWDQECCLRFANKVPFLFSLCQPSEQRKTWGDSRPISRPASANIIAGKFVRSGQLSSVPFQWKQIFLDSHSFHSYTVGHGTSNTKTKSVIFGAVQNIRVVIRLMSVAVFAWPAPGAVVSQSHALLKVVHVQRALTVVVGWSAFTRLNHGREASVVNGNKEESILMHCSCLYFSSASFTL